MALIRLLASIRMKTRTPTGNLREGDGGAAGSFQWEAQGQSPLLGRLTDSTPPLEKEGLREAHGGGWAGGRGTPKYNREERTGTQKQSPKGCFLRRWGDERQEPGPPTHTVWFIGSSHTHTKYVHP